ncbi:MAG: carbamoyltransferase [Ignavibacteriae bacterium]|nr:carbamoyltransferase [Ignavibacteriota bacterium]
MGKNILGISAFYHDSAAAIISNGEIIAAAQEERFSRKKHDPRFPINAINYCLQEAFIEPGELDAIVFYDNPLRSFDRIIKNFIMTGENGLAQFEKAIPSILGVKLWIQDYVKNSIGTLGKIDKLLYSEHHLSHAASAFYPSPFDNAAIITIDGVGEWSTSTIGIGNGNKIEMLKEINYPHSLGLLYSAITYYCGFKVNSGEYKLMGLAPYGKPEYFDLILDNLIDVKDDGSYMLNTEYFGYLDSLKMTNDKFNSLFGGNPRDPESRITYREMNIAASIQKVLEYVMLKMAKYVRKDTGMENLVLAGGVALNCVSNGLILKEKIFDNIWIQPAAGDAGGALGSALAINYLYFSQERKLNPTGRDSQKGSYLGPAFSNNEIQAFLDRNDYPYERIENGDTRFTKIAEALSEGKIVGYFGGRMEFGPRALGARSIIGDPRNIETQSKMNLKIKYRESFRPFAPSALAEDVSKYFEMDVESPYMLLVAPVKEERRLPFDLGNFLDNDDDMIRIVNKARSDIPAITHVDYSARVQTVNILDKPDYHNIIKKFKEITGYGVIVNTSFNVRGEPIVCTPLDAYKCFMRSDIDILVLEEYILHKTNQPNYKDKENWKEEYELD